MPLDTAINTYLYLLRRNADERRLQQIEEALTPPVTYRVGGAPAWYGDDDEAWQQFEREARR